MKCGDGGEGRRCAARVAGATPRRGFAERVTYFVNSVVDTTLHRPRRVFVNLADLVTDILINAGVAIGFCLIASVTSRMSPVARLIRRSYRSS